MLQAATKSTPPPQAKYYSPDRGPDLRKAPRDGSDERNRWVVSHMWEIHHEIARRLVLGQKNVEIAEALNVTPVMVSNVRNSPIVQERITILKGARDADTIDLAREIKEVAPEALGLLKDIIRGENDGANAPIGLRARTSENMLARVGHGVPHKVQTENVHTILTAEDIAEIKRRAQCNANVVDAEFSVKED